MANPKSAKPLTAPFDLQSSTKVEGQQKVRELPERIGIMPKFDPVPIKGEPLSATIIRSRGEY